MAGFRIENFKGLRPRISAKKLPPGEAVVAENLNLGSGDLEPIAEKTIVQAATSGRMPKTIYLFDNAGNPIWFEWDDYVDVARGPVKDDSLERTYYTGDTLGNGAPKLTTTTLADLGNGGPYPEDWWYVGVPAPTVKPTVTPTALPEDEDAQARLATNFKTDELVVDEVQWTVHPGTGSRDQTWSLSDAAFGLLRFEAQPGTSFRVASVINLNKVTLESATEPGITIRSLNRDKTTVNDWQPMEEGGTTQEADFLGWRIPTGMEVTIPDHKLNVGDVIVVSAVNAPPQLAIPTATTFYEQDWPGEIPITEGATTFQRVIDARVSASAVSGDTPWLIAGSFYYDVDRASSTVSELEDRTYVYTYVNSLGEEGPPSPPSDSLPLLDETSVLISDLALPPTIGYDITQMRLYRTNSTEAGTEFQFVKEFDVARTVRDEVPSSSLGEIIATTTWDPPVPEMKGIVALPNGILAGFNGKQLYFCEPYFPHAYPPEYDKAVEYEIVGLATFGNALAVLTKGWPYIATGTHSRNMNLRPLKINQSCLSKESIATDSDRVYYASPDGIVELSTAGIRVATADILDPEDWMEYSPSTIVGEFYKGRYYGFYDFDVSAVDPVITAEVSGTITDADEQDIFDGGRVITVTLTNDEWVAEGATFDTERQGIIDGLVAATDQTLGWNNIVRDTVLGVTDVVRTSDTVVTITLPAAPAYSIAEAERVQLTIPSSALLASVASVPAGSTFRIEPREVVTSVVMTGTLGGALEADVVTGGRTIILTLTDDTFVNPLTTQMKQDIITGLRATTSEQDGWNDNVPQLISVDSVVRTSDSVVTITLPAVDDYAVTANETITALVPYQALAVQPDQDAESSNSLGIIAAGLPAALFSGSATESMTENEVIAGGKELVITLTNDTWIAAGTGPIGTTAQSEALRDAILSQTDPANGWNNVVQPGIDVPGDLVRTSDTVATITLDAEALYSISANETIGATFTADLLVTSVTPLAVSNTFGVLAQFPVTALLSGSILSDTVESDIVTGGKVITLTLSNDTWVDAGATFDAQRQPIIDGLTATASPTNGWNNELRDGSLSVTDVVRTSDTVVTVTLPADAQYDIDSTETVIATIPAAAMNISASNVVATPSATIDAFGVVTATITGTLAGASTGAITDGGQTIIITMANDTWVTGATFTSARQAIIDGLTAASSPTNGWNDEVRDGTMAPGDVVRTSDTVVTVTVPATADYDVGADEIITVTVPASALAASVSAVVGTPTVTIDASGATTSTLLIAASENLGVDGEAWRSKLDVGYWTQINPVKYNSNNVGSLNAVAYLPTGTLWVANGLDWGSPAGTWIQTSADNGATWTQRTAAFTPSDDAGIAIAAHDDFGVIIAGDNDSAASGEVAQWSANGTTSWTNISTAMFAPATADAITVHDVQYDGTYLYAKCDFQLSGPPYTSNNFLSIDISGVQTPSYDWDNEFASNMTVTKQQFGLGEGKLINFGQVGSKARLEHMNQGGTSLTLAADTLPSSSRAYPQFVAFDGTDKWVALNTVCQAWTVDTSGANTVTDPSDWSASTGYVFGTGGETLFNLFYDKGSDGTSGAGFVAVTQFGTGVATQTKVYTSTNGTSWTLQETFAAPSFHSRATAAAGKHPLATGDLT